MKLPKSESAIAPERKVKLYLLNPAPPPSDSKAAFFLRIGSTQTTFLPRSRNVPRPKERTGKS